MIPVDDGRGGASAAVRVRAPLIRDVACVVVNMRAADRAECAAMGGASPADAVRRSLALSIEAYAGVVDGEAVCLFGLGAGSIAGGVARPWLLGTDGLPQHAVPFLRRNREMVRRWAASWPVLENWIDERNAASIRWLRWLGFTIHPVEPFGPYRKPFHRFDMRQG